MRAFLRKRWRLFCGIVAGIILLFTLLVLFQTNILHQQPKTHNTVQFNNKNIYPVFPGDSLAGKGIKNSLIVLEFSSEGDNYKFKKEIQTKKDGTWFYVIPYDVKKGEYIVLVKILDRASTVVYSKKYIVRIESSNKQKSELSLSTKQQKGTPDVENQGHPQLFFANLEYNPSTNKVSEIKTGRINGDIPKLLPIPPANSSDRFIYKLEFISPSGLLTTGWESLPKEVIQTKEGNLRFTVTAPYQQKSILQMYLQNGKLLWRKII